MKKLFLITLICLLLFSCKKKHTYYVSSSGSDNNPGTEEQPFATISKAQEAWHGSPKVFFRQGVYYLAEPVVFTRDDSRKEHAPLNIMAYNDEKVIVSEVSVLKD